MLICVCVLIHVTECMEDRSTILVFQLKCERWQSRVLRSIPSVLVILAQLPRLTNEELLTQSDVTLGSWLHIEVFDVFCVLMAWAAWSLTWQQKLAPPP